MAVFISHSFQNQADFENIADALKQRGVPYWNPAEIKPGASLRDQLRAAVERCHLCIFVATRDSLKSSWCGAELGAFWGAGKKVIVYMAEGSLTEEELPPIVQGDAWERRISRIADHAHEVIVQAMKHADGKPVHRASPVAQLSVGQFEKLLAGVVSLGAASVKDKESPQNYQDVETALKGVAGMVLAGFRATEAVAADFTDNWHNKILWVDDKPNNNLFERQAMESMGLQFALALSTDEALSILSSQRFGAIISGMERKEGPREGYVLLEAVRSKDTNTPFFIYANSHAAQHQNEARLRGAQGLTSIAEELVEMVVRSLPIESSTAQVDRG